MLILYRPRVRGSGATQMRDDAAGYISPLPRPCVRPRAALPRKTPPTHLHPWLSSLVFLVEGGGAHVEIMRLFFLVGGRGRI